MMDDTAFGKEYMKAFKAFSRAQTKYGQSKTAEQFRVRREEVNQAEEALKEARQQYLVAKEQSK